MLKKKYKIKIIEGWGFYPEEEILINKLMSRLRDGSAKKVKERAINLEIELYKDSGARRRICLGRHYGWIDRRGNKTRSWGIASENCGFIIERVAVKNAKTYF